MMDTCSLGVCVTVFGGLDRGCAVILSCFLEFECENDVMRSHIPAALHLEQTAQTECIHPTGMLTPVKRGT
jgi:hypothetical protein